MYINKKYIEKNDYKIIQNNDDELRTYDIEINQQRHKFFSVTSILSQIELSDKLKEIKNTLGESGWEYVRDRGASRGSVMHKYLENFLFYYHQTKNIDESLTYTQNNTISSDEIKDIYKKKKKFWNLGRDLFYNFYHSQWLKQIDEIVFLEMMLFSIDYKYAGTADLCYVNGDKMIMGDFKSSTTKKTKEDIKNYEMQLNAYMYAFNEMYGISVDHAEILIAHGTELDVFTVKFDQKIFDEFVELTNKLYNQNN